MLKSRRALKLSRIFVFGTVLYTVLYLCFVFFLWNSISNKSESPGIRAPLIVDMDCLKNLRIGRSSCQFPIKVAVPVGKQFHEGYFTRIEYNLKDDPAKRFWFFHNIKNGTESVATKRFKTKLTTLHLVDDLQIQLEMPAEVDGFARAWRNGRFLDCKPVLIRPKNVARRIAPSFLDNIVKFTDLVAQYNATAFIFSGTLLGWRRECSLIPHTTDTDMAIFHEEHSNALLRAILTSPTFEIYYAMGRLRDSFLLGVYVSHVKIDLFYLYNHNNFTYLNSMRQEERQRVRQAYPRLSGQICTGELHGRLVHVPCDYQKVIEAEYGRDEWQEDLHSDKFYWDKSPKNMEWMEVHPEEEWKNVFLLVRNTTERFNPVKVDEWMANINKTL